MESKNGKEPRPPRLEPLGLAEFERKYVSDYPHSVSRAKIFSKYRQYLRDFRGTVGVSFTQWINGSFTTTKPDPSDIDVVNLVDSTSAAAHETKLRSFLTVGGSLNVYRVDGYLVQVYPTDDPRYYVTQMSLNYWASWFGFDLQGNEKIVVELLIS